MNYYLIVLLVVSSIFGSNALFFSSSSTWSDLKVTWGINPFSSSNFASLPRTESEAQRKGWTKEKDCSQVNGVRYVLNGDRAVLLVFDVRGVIAGIASAIPKSLPFNFPSAEQQEYLNDEGDVYTITAYFVEPTSVCSALLSNGQTTGNQLVIKGSSKQVEVPLKESDVKSFWTKGQCFYTMGVHYWAQTDGAALTEQTNAEQFFPVFLLYNKGNLNGFGWAFNAGLTSTRYEHPGKEVLPKFMVNIPGFFSDSSKSNVLSTLHIYLDSTPQLNFC